MAESKTKRYYWLKFNQDFFKSLRIKKLRRLAGGDTFTIIYLKLQLFALNTEGIIEYKGVFDSFEEEMAEEIDEDVENIAITVSYLLSCGLMEQADNKYILPYVVENTGSECESLERVKSFRERQKALHCNGTVTECNATVTNCNATNVTSNTEKEKEREKDKEKEKDKYIAEIRLIIEYLNQVCGTHYRYQTEVTQRHIRARLNEKFTVDDFKRVIDKKHKEWFGTDMQKYLCPETLFGNKFEKYLNQPEETLPRTNGSGPAYDWDNL